MVSEPEPIFKPKGDPVPLDQLADLTEDGEVVIRRSDVEKAIAEASGTLKPYLEAKQYKPKR